MIPLTGCVIWSVRPEDLRSRFVFDIDCMDAFFYVAAATASPSHPFVSVAVSMFLLRFSLNTAHAGFDTRSNE